MIKLLRTYSWTLVLGLVLGIAGWYPWMLQFWITLIVLLVTILWYDSRPRQEERMEEDEIVQMLLAGLLTDGAHHKQMALEKVLRMICEDEWVNKVKEELQWEDVIPA